MFIKNITKILSQISYQFYQVILEFLRSFSIQLIFHQRAKCKCHDLSGKTPRKKSLTKFKCLGGNRKDRCFQKFNKYLKLSASQKVDNSRCLLDQCCKSTSCFSKKQSVFHINVNIIYGDNYILENTFSQV